MKVYFRGRRECVPPCGGDEAADAVEHDREPVVAVGVGHEVSGNEDCRIAPRQTLRVLGSHVLTGACNSGPIRVSTMPCVLSHRPRIRLRPRTVTPWAST